MMSLQKKVFLFFFFIAVILRVGFVLKLPTGINQDEISNLYDAWSIAETGKDRYNTFPPTTLRAYGEADYRPALFTYIGSLPFLMTEPSIEVFRLMGVLISLIGLFYFFKLIDYFVNDDRIKYITYLLITFSPWNIFFSGIAFEGTTLAPTLFILTIYHWLKWRKHYRVKRIIVLAIFAALYAFSYQSAKLIAFILGISISIDILRITKRWKTTLLFVLACLIFTSPYLFEIIYYPTHFFGRAGNTAMDFEPWFTYGWVYLIGNFFSHFNPQYLFFELNNVVNVTPFRLLILEGLFFYFGLFSFKNNSKWTLFWFLLSLSILPGIFTKENPNPIRASNMMYLTPIASAWGIQILLKQFKKYKTHLIVLITLGLLFSFFTQYKIFWGDQELRKTFRPELTEIYQEIGKMKLNGPLYIQKIGSPTYIYHAWFSEIHPKDFKQMPITSNSEEGEFDKVTRLGATHWLTPEQLADSVALDRPGNYIFFNTSYGRYPTPGKIFYKNGVFKASIISN